MRRTVSLIGIVVVAALIVAGVTLRFVNVAQASSPGHFHETDTFPDMLCGFSGTTVLITVDNFGSKASGATYDSGRFEQIFTADNGHSVKLTYDAGRLVFYPRVMNADGTMTQIAVTDGLNIKTQAVNGPVLQQSTGRARFTFVSDADGSTISFTAVALAGPENNLSGAEDCSVIGPYLAGA
jgi:hypothetical protein